MRTTLIITTYNWPEALKSVLDNVAKQSVMPDEVIIADDGSTKETSQLIASMTSSFPVPLIHSWQKDKGFRLSRSRNKAIHLSEMDYIIMIDGDMLLHKHFIADHKKVAEKDFFITGKRIKLGGQLSQQALSQQTQLSFFSQGIHRGRELSLRSAMLQRFYSKRNIKSIEGVHGCNLAFWRQDALAINGFNTEFEGWGPEDKEFALRMINNGTLRKQLKFYGVAYHLEHNETNKDLLQKNEQIFAETQSNQIVRCKLGLCEFINQLQGNKLVQ